MAGVVRHLPSLEGEHGLRAPTIEFAARSRRAMPSAVRIRARLRR